MDRSECPLTPAEHEALLLVVQGKTYQQAARHRGVSSSTIRSLLHRAYQRLGVSNVIQAAAMMFREGWTEPEEVVGADEFTTWLRARGRDDGWRPSAAQRCYLTAFGRLLWLRDVASAYRVHLAFLLMCAEAGVRVPRAAFDPVNALARLDEMLDRFARCLTRPLYDGLEAA